MSWLTIGIVLIVFAGFFAIAFRFEDTPSGTTGFKDFFGTVGMMGFIVFFIFSIFYSINCEKFIVVEKIYPTYTNKSKKELYLEFDTKHHLYKRTYTDIETWSQTDSTTAFYEVTTYNLYDRPSYSLYKTSWLRGFDENNLGKKIKNIW